MSYKIRRIKSQIKVGTGVEDNKSWQIKKEVNMFKSERENLNLELNCKTDELQQINFVREIECEISSLITFMLTNIDNVDDAYEKLALFDELINNVISKLLDVLYISQYSPRDLE